MVDQTLANTTLLLWCSKTNKIGISARAHTREAPVWRMWGLAVVISTALVLGFTAEMELPLCSH